MLAVKAECRGFESPPGAGFLFPWKKELSWLVCLCLTTSLCWHTRVYLTPHNSTTPMFQKLLHTWTQPRCPWQEHNSAVPRASSLGTPAPYSAIPAQSDHMTVTWPGNDSHVIGRLTTRWSMSLYRAPNSRDKIPSIPSVEARGRGRGKLKKQQNFRKWNLSIKDTYCEPYWYISVYSSSE